MNSLHVFLLLELYTIRQSKKEDNIALRNFRHLVTNYIKNSSTYNEFISLLSTSCLYLDKDVCRLCLSFKKYVEHAYKIWDNLSNIS